MIIKYCSRQMIERLIPEDNAVLISIAGTKDRFARIRDEEWKGVLRLRFDDLQRDLGEYRAMTETQAHSILTFVNNQLPVHYLYVNCEAGISRSAGVCVALEQLYNNQNKFLPLCNVHVKNLLLKVGGSWCV